jgi:hypothetical protein
MQLDASTGLGVKFYEFEHISNLREFKALYREKLDSLGKTTAAAAPAAAATATTTAAAAAAASDSTSTRRTRTIVMTSSVADLMVAEANYAFELNTVGDFDRFGWVGGLGACVLAHFACVLARSLAHFSRSLFFSSSSFLFLPLCS